MVGKHIFVSGRVQGVGFRYFANECAQEFAIKGWVRNLDDGRVEILAFGQADELQAFLDVLRQGPPNSHVAGFEVSDAEMKKQLLSFGIRRDGGPLWPED